MLRHALLPLRWVRCRPRTILPLFVLVVALSAGGVNLWAWYHYRQAAAALRGDDMDKARRHISSCLRVWRWSYATHLLAARIDRVSGHYPQAEEQLRECARLHHGPTEETQLEQVLLRAQTGELREVERPLAECVKQNHPESARILETLARVYMNERRMTEAWGCVERWVKLEPGVARAWDWRGWLSERKHQPELAIADYEKALEIEPQRWRVRLRLAVILIEKADPDGDRHLQELMRSHGDEPDVQITQARAYLLKGKTEESIAVLDRLLQTHPHDPQALYWRGSAAMRLSRYSEAETFLVRALQQEPANYLTLFKYSQCLNHQEGKAKQAAEMVARCKLIEDRFKRLEKLEKQIEDAPYNPDLLNEMGQLMLELEQEDRAVQWLRRSERLAPGYKPTYEILFNYYRTHDKPERAEVIRKQFLEKTGQELAPPTPAK